MVGGMPLTSTTRMLDCYSIKSYARVESVEEFEKRCDTWGINSLDPTLMNFSTRIENLDFDSKKTRGIRTKFLITQLARNNKKFNIEKLCRANGLKEDNFEMHLRIYLRKHGKVLHKQEKRCIIENYK